ncbi:hypothetical protein [Lutimonas zeaxanthinifaciens]|uniref:hypothetical protein n=1 Tax=Lutimonas zeaxanthinifaciens TaxID=3060215 RepID=UPI00265C9AF9|nr:hypothetical protein [Lutimonas sp. YSD2104]WKK67489.1 hypothetical protein QZH61_07640 [Lutimonas sp. YSD2104]
MPLKNLTRAIFVFIFVFTLPRIGFSQIEKQFNGIRLKESLQSVKTKLDKISENSKIIQVKKPLYPLAKYDEKHLVCTGINLEKGTINEAVFTFSDDSLTFIEAKGNVERALVSQVQDTVSWHYIGYDVYQKQKLFVHKENDVARIMTEEAIHPNLFVWENPYLNGNGKAEPLENTGMIPSFIKMGASYSELQMDLESHSAFTSRRDLPEGDPNAQYQINCFGVNYLGFPRKIEARFGDDILNVVWILTAKGEEDRIRKALIKQFGKPVFEDENWEIYNDWQVGLRKDKPEVLLLEKELGQVYKKEFFKQ